MTATLQHPAAPAQTGQPGAPAVRRFRPDIEGLRAVAVTLVVLSHVGLGFAGGYVGVDVFFVVSGFLITSQLFGELSVEHKISLRTFYARRTRRILPAATVVIVGTLLAAWHWDSPLRARSDLIDGLFAAFSGINWRLASTGTDYFALGSAPSPFQHFWSLAVEEQFYAIWPALMVAVAAWFGSRFGRRPALIWTLLVIMLVSLVLSVRTTSTSPSWAYFGLQTRAWELALGGLLAVTVTVWTRLPPAFASQLSWLGLGLIGLSALTYGAATVYPGRAVVMPVLGSAFVIAGGCPGWPHGAELALRQRPMQFLGRTSYSWYLTHWPVLTILPLALGHPLSLDDKWLVVIGSLGLAIAIFYLVEQPIRSPSFAFLIGRPRYGLAFGAVLVSTSIAAALVLSAHTTVFGSGPVNPAAIASPSDQSVVAAAVRAGAALTNLPAHLTPSLAKASGDHPAATGRCLLGDTATRPLPDAQCTFGDPNGSRTVAFIGDSHANAWEPAIDAFAKANGYRLVMYAMAACPPGVYPDDVDPTTNRIYTACNEFRAAVFARLRVLRPAYVIVTSELRTLSIDPTGTVQSIHQYQAAGARVIYLEDTPNAQRIGLVPDCLAKHPNAIGQCAMKRDDPATRLGAMIQRRTENQAAQEAGATLLDPTDWFCSSTTCPPIIDDIVVYSDDSHITATYATWLAPVMSAALKKITG